MREHSRYRPAPAVFPDNTLEEIMGEELWSFRFSLMKGNTAVSGNAGANWPATGYSSSGGGLFNAATASVTQCTFLSNNVTGGPGSINQTQAGDGGPGQGGGICNMGTMVVAGCLVAGNAATGGVGADNNGDIATPGQGYGGGIFNGGSQLAVITTTVHSPTLATTFRRIQAALFPGPAASTIPIRSCCPWPITAGRP